ncbi:hypothetical protein AWZ03_012381 [Drosophila navojoa]|uniref:Uncharacterized protein n=1 Tax=Drosophila navojoa TaxID=7232 RepID=A0A484AX29_DRONA|nr:uncharacterized protein LOC115564483 [Drosophila navojoa]TDG41207.1 hypothetical protein AWZ03_012381 [Drosophila navojoa]
MAFLRSFRISNQYIRFSALLLLRFYLAQFYFLGLLRLRYRRKGNAVHLTHYSVTVSRLVALPFAYFLSLALLSPYSSLLYMQPYLFLCFFLWQPRRVHEERVRLINGFLRLAPALHRLTRCQLQVSWLLVLQLALKLLTMKIYWWVYRRPSDVITKFGYVLLIALPGSLSVWCLDMAAHLISICLYLLLASFEQLNTELQQQLEQLHMKTLHADYGAVKRLQRRLLYTQRLYEAYARLTQQLLDTLAPQLLQIVVYNLTMIYALSFGHWRRLLDILMLANGLRILFQSLDALVVATRSPRDTTWMHLAQLLQLNQALAMHGWLDRHCSTSGHMYSSGQSMRRVLLQPRLQILGLFTPNRRFFFRLLFCYCSYLHVSYVWHKRLPVHKGEIFNLLLL